MKTKRPHEAAPPSDVSPELELLYRAIRIAPLAVVLRLQAEGADVRSPASLA